MNVIDRIERLDYDNGVIYDTYDGKKITAIEAEEILRLAKQGQRTQEVRTINEWVEDYGDVLWYKFPVEEPPYVGSPLDCDWPGYHTHWTLLPELPKQGDT